MTGSGITVTVDLEDPTGIYDPSGRYLSMARRLIDFCGERQCRATFFVVGRVAEAAPDLVKRIAASGHEIAYHSHAHHSLTEEVPEIFRQESRIDKNRLEQLAGKAVIGFRAPRYSLTPSTLWAVDILGELGFRYSSSIMPTSFSLFGFKGASDKPFKWPNGLIEFPLPVGKLGPLRVPYLGGIYLYVLPFSIVRRFVKKAESDEVLWTYAHPYDFDTEEPYAPMPGSPAWVSRVLWLARGRAERQLRRVTRLGTAGPLSERMMVIHRRIR
ncbi:MAG: DUF3473 domain-containing protein [Alphaproteobacteria bacterium]|nr:DUF3473 domain-containing protein [Alphaproteobacteria bacterium]